MKLFTGLVMSAGLVLTAAAANAQVLAPYEIGRPPYSMVSDFNGPYSAMPPDGPMLPDGPVAGYGPRLLPPPEVYAIVRQSGFSPLGIPHQRGFVYTIAVIDRGGDDGRLEIDGRSGRIIRFMPAYRMGDSYDSYDEGMTARHAPVVGPQPPVTTVRGVPRPPRPIPRVASRTSVPTPKPLPPHAGEVPHASEVKPQAAKPAAEPAQQSAAVQAKPADAQSVPQSAAPPAIEAKPAAPQILPTQEMPKVEGFE